MSSLLMNSHETLSNNDVVHMDMHHAAYASDGNADLNCAAGSDGNADEQPLAASDEQFIIGNTVVESSSLGTEEHLKNVLDASASINDKAFKSAVLTDL